MAERAKLNEQMGQPNFWDNPEKAQQIIQQLKPLNGLSIRFAALETSLEDLKALAQLSEEDASLDEELAQELTNLEKKLGDFELRAVLSGPQDGSNAFVKVQAGTAAPTRATGPRCSCACTCAGPSGMASGRAGR